MKTIYTKLFIFLLLLPASMLAQSVSGTVTEQANGLPLPGASIVVQGTSNGTSSDIDGKFTLEGVKKGDVIVVSSIGFTQQTVTYNGQKTLSFALAEEASQLQEVVVQVGYGTTRKKDVTGSVTTVTAKDFNKGAIVTTENLLNGKVAGLTINTSGAPGSGSEIRIRGGASLTASNDPLIVVDGFPISTPRTARSTTVSRDNTGSTSFLASINPNTIESITVLKDASATAIYGSRASNGVIIIVTKKGGKNLKVDYNLQYGVGRLADKVDVLNANQFRNLIATRYPITDTTAPNYLTNLGINNRLGTANTDWQDAIYRNTDLVDQNLSLSGNLFKKVPTRLTLNNTRQEGLRLTNVFERTSVNLAMNPSFLNDHLKLRINATLSKEANRFAEGVEGNALRFDPTQPIYDATSPFGGFFEYYTINAQGNAQIDNLAPRNPVAQLLQRNDNGRNKRFLGNFELDYKFHFLPDLRFVANVAFDQADGERTIRVPATAASAANNGNVPYGNDEFTEEVRRSKLADIYLNYTKRIGDLNLDLTAGYSYQRFDRELRFTSNILQPGYDGTQADTETNTPLVLIGFFGRANISFKDKYVLTLSGRRDGSSKFVGDNRWGFFPAASFAWRLKEEFFKDSQSVSDFKLRVGYGISGQQDVPADQTVLFVVNGDAYSQYIMGDDALPIVIPSVYNPDLKWEETATTNVGLDFGFLDNRITGSVDAFYKVSKDLLVEAAVADGSNFSNRVLQNVGSFTTRGLEFQISADVIRKEKFTWNVNFNAATYQRKIDELIYNTPFLVGDNIAGTGTQVNYFSEGYSPFGFLVFKQLYDSNNKPIEGAYADLNGDNVINDNDRYIYHDPDPDLTLGLASTVNFGNFDFSFNMRASLGAHVFNAFQAGNAQYGLLLAGNGLANTPSITPQYGFEQTSNVVTSDIWIEDASFLRMDNITLGYTFPEWIDKKASLRLSAGVQNAFLLTKYSGLDPELSNNGVDKTTYPRQRTFLFGVNVKF